MNASNVIVGAGLTKIMHQRGELMHNIGLHCAMASGKTEAIACARAQEKPVFNQSMGPTS
ncbi:MULTISPECIES: hypothetical protein [Thauera]|jgi:hypothetical protein|uniref:Uncharacterized protein n=1 Tax=Thauera aminoaromatica TaxID=164330 RepID=A0A5C7S409_THASP|nr:MULTISPECIES: hypothetical protein [Thauera]MDA0236497.1 hypothetical protein [Pseudomonadota bacterium]MBP6132958.1 hypothetical protein [Thauera sp.]MBP7048262.1 hypothetical protein [Thauera sp.]TXH78668.1 MAG: hypothetical protein E6Q80_22125 [Thauera aminoaromatica]HMY78479.1 hypothetical protein [Thauera aminoaromatica]